jgi:ATP-dependent Clp protease ATP-binding subunit ClpA
MRFDRFTPEAREAVRLANEESARLGHPWLGTEHLLLGLLRQPDTPARAALAGLGVTSASVERELVDELGEPAGTRTLGEEDAEALRTLGIDLGEIRRRVEEAFGPGALDRARPGRCGLPMMPRLKQTMERAASGAGSGAIDTDHLLVGMMGVKGALAVLLVERLGTSPSADRARGAAGGFRETNLIRFG